LVGHPIHPHAAVALKQLGGDASGFAARRLTTRISSDADLILTMTLAHRNAVLELAPRKMRSTFTLSEAAHLTTKYGAENPADLASLRAQVNTRDLTDIRDPIGENLEVFAEVAAQIADLLLPILAVCH
jgi:protein-tyrosine phosphatase